MATVLIAAGGTAGHVVPALAVADALRARGSAVSFAGTPDRAEATLVPQAGYDFDPLSLTGISRTNPLQALAAVGRTMSAIPTARGLLKRRGVDAVMGGGGYVSAPVGAAAVASRLPLVLTEADSHLGLANRLLARRARRVCLAFAIPGREPPKFIVTGRPVPEAIVQADRRAARERYGVPLEARCLLVFGGSLGARTINDAALAAFADPAGPAAERAFHVLHIAGRRDFPEAEPRAEGSSDYTLLEYEPDLGDALAAADLVLARAGGSVFELAAAGRPAILVPYPHATAAHQHENAAWMVDGGAAVTIEDSELTPAMLAERAAGLIADESTLARMAQASAGLAMPDAAERIADEILAVCP